MDAFSAMRERAVDKDDWLDATIAAALGVLMLSKSETVALYGSQELGAMLLPKRECFDEMLKQ